MTAAKSPVVSRAEPGKGTCPACLADSKGCSVTADGLHICRGEPSPADWKEVTKQPDANGFRHYRRAADKPFTARPPGPVKPAPDWIKLQSHRVAGLTASPHYQARLAADLKLPPDALTPFGLGLRFVPGGGEEYSVPERSGTGAIVGLATRFYPGGDAPADKKCVKGSARGLTLPTGWRDRPGPVFVVEGFTDAAALTAAGLCAVGRPGNRGGADHLAALLADWPADRPVILIVENDRKPDGNWPGREGSEATAGALAGRLRRAVNVAAVPGDAKDVRAWLTDPAREGMSWLARGADLAGLLTAALEVVEPSVPGGPTEKSTGLGVDVTEPRHLAETFLARRHRREGDAIDSRLVVFRGRFLAWSNGAYRELADDRVDADMTRHAEAEAHRDHVARLEAYDRAVKESDGAKVPKLPVRAKITRTIVADAINSVRARPGVLLADELDPPCWLTPRGCRPDPAALVPTETAVIDPVGGEVFDPTPELFNLTASPHYRPDAGEPTATLAYLNWLFEGDPERVGALQEFFGLCATGLLRFQKAVLIVGRSGTGKSEVVGKLLEHFVGPRNYGGTSWDKLGGRFGLANIDGRSAAVIDDLRTDCRSQQDRAAMSLLLSLVAGGAVPCERKGQDVTTVRVSARLLLFSNEMPKLRDDSPDAIIRRLLVLPTGDPLPLARRDTQLIDKLLPELPGLFAWAMVGLRRLLERGRFEQPQAAEARIRRLHESSSDVAMFASEGLTLDPEAFTPTQDLYAAYRRWCEVNAVKSEDRIGRCGDFVSRLVGLFPSIKKGREAAGRPRRWGYEGVRLASEDEVVLPPSYQRPGETEGDRTTQTSCNEDVPADPSYRPTTSSKSLYMREEEEDTLHMRCTGGGIGASAGRQDGSTSESAVTPDLSCAYASASSRPAENVEGGRSYPPAAETPSEPVVTPTTPPTRTRKRSVPDDRPASVRPPQQSSRGPA